MPASDEPEIQTSILHNVTEIIIKTTDKECPTSNLNLLHHTQA
jgi:hypothetical protein